MTREFWAVFEKLFCKPFGGKVFCGVLRCKGNGKSKGKREGAENDSPHRTKNVGWGPRAEERGERQKHLTFYQ